MIEILRNKNKFIGCKKKSRCYTLKAAIAIFKDDIKYYVVLKNVKDSSCYFQWFWGIELKCFHDARYQVPRCFLKLFFDFILSILCYIYFCVNQKIFTSYDIKFYLWCQIFLKVSNLIAVYIKKTVIPNISVSSWSYNTWGVIILWCLYNSCSLVL